MTTFTNTETFIRYLRFISDYVPPGQYDDVLSDVSVYLSVSHDIVDMMMGASIDVCLQVWAFLNRIKSLRVFMRGYIRAKYTERVSALIELESNHREKIVEVLLGTYPDSDDIIDGMLTVHPLGGDIDYRESLDMILMCRQPDGILHTLYGVSSFIDDDNLPSILDEFEEEACNLVR
jgi:hypothetical protein